MWERLNVTDEDGRYGYYQPLLSPPSDLRKNVEGSNHVVTFGGDEVSVNNVKLSIANVNKSSTNRQLQLRWDD